MLHIRSKPDEIAYHIMQMELLLLNEKEKNQINQILALEKLTKDESIKELIEEDLQDEKWINDTSILINTCYKKIERSLMVQKHIEECRNFIVFRYLETKCATCQIEIFKQIGSWIFNEIDNKQEKCRWVNPKFMTNFEHSDIPKKFLSYMENNPRLEINLSWLYQHRHEIFSEEVFVDFKQILKQKRDYAQSLI